MREEDYEVLVPYLLIARATAKIQLIDCEELPVAAPEVQVAEFLRQVRWLQIPDVLTQIARLETRAAEMGVLPTSEQCVEILQVCVHEVPVQVPYAKPVQRIAQTGFVFDPNVLREQVIAKIVEALWSSSVTPPPW